MNCEQIHETVIGEIEEVIKGTRELRKDNKMIGNKSWSSIAKATSNLTLVFPVLISRNIPIETAQIVTKACERDNVSMLQVLFSAMSITQAKDGIEYLKTIHNNLSLGDKIDLDAFINVMDSTPVKEAVSYIEAYDLIKEDMKNINHTLDDSISEAGLNEYQLLKNHNNYVLLQENPRKIRDSMVEHIKSVPTYCATAYFNDFKSSGEYIKRIYDTYTTQSIKAKFYKNDKSVNDVPYTETLSDDDMYLASMVYDYINNYNADIIDHNEYMEIDDIKNAIDHTISYKNYDNMFEEDDPFRVANNQIANAIFSFYSRSRMRAEGTSTEKIARLFADNADGQSRDERQNIIDDRRYRLDAKTLALARAKFRYQKTLDIKKQQMDDAKARQQYETDLYNRNSRMLIDTDVKKANEMIPTLMNVQFTKVVNNYPVVSSMIVGVKAKMVPLDSQDIMNRIIMKNKDNNFFIKFFRATTREISFVKDLVLAIDKAKSDALSFSKKGKSNKIWKVLERRSKKSAISKILNTNNSAMAISTLIITAEEVEALKKMNNIDMADPKTAAGIMQSYNLMAFGIADDMMQTFKIMRDNGDNTFDTYAYSALERELQDGQYKKIVNMMAKNGNKM